jgi:hypothetical protein
MLETMLLNSETVLFTSFIGEVFKISSSASKVIVVGDETV